MGKSISDIARQNFHYFQEVVGDYIDENRGRYALVHSRAVIGIFDKPIDAALAGASRFSDGHFSIQRVTDQPADLGFMAYGAGDRAPD